jgi:hypothetical protein
VKHIATFLTHTAAYFSLIFFRRILERRVFRLGTLGTLVTTRHRFIGNTGMLEKKKLKK